MLPLTFTFKNVGPVRNADLELGDLTIIAGRNNTGKTYLAYTLYGFLQWLQAAIRVPPVFGAETVQADSARLPLLKAITKRVTDRYEASLKLDRIALTRERRLLAGMLAASFSKHELARTFSSPPDRFAGASIDLQLDNDLASQPREIAITTANGDSFSIRLDEEGSVSLTVAPPTGSVDDRTRRQLAYVLYLHATLPELLLLDPFVLSAERIGISLFHRELDFRNSRLVAELQTLDDGRDKRGRSPLSLIREATSRYARPIRDNIDYTRSIPEYRNQKSEIPAGDLSRFITDMMNGYYRASRDDIAYVSAARGRGRFVLPLYLASSSARGLSDLYFFLRHVARKYHLLIVDEPESHLDTANQIVMARLLSRLVESGVKVLITTHSDYIIKELNNLIMLNSDFGSKGEVIKRLKYEEADCLDPERIRAYIAKDGTLIKCDIDKFGIDMPNFDETIDSINNVANELSAWLSVDEGE